MKKNYVILLFSVIALIMLFPVIFALSNSFMSGAEIADRYAKTITPTNWFDFTLPPIHFARLGLIPDYLTARQYLELFFLRPDILRYFWNSVLITLPVVLGQCLVSAPAAYAFEQMRWKHKEIAFFVYAVIMLMPLQVVMVPNFIVAEWLGLRKSYLAIILPGIFTPFGTFLIRQQLRGFPKEYYEAAQMDGASHRCYFLKVVLPAVKPTIAALAILTFVEYWNMVDQAVVFIRESWREPMSVFLSALMTQETAMLFVASVFYMLPAIFVFLLGQEQMVQGIQLSGLKA
ncbi:MAG: carbohydrate ABC transporter permease [Caldicoprobacteraceae bacterium]|jgi:multiple sugar transport system permease protein